MCGLCAAVGCAASQLDQPGLLQATDHIGGIRAINPNLVGKSCLVEAWALTYDAENAVLDRSHTEAGAALHEHRRVNLMEAPDQAALAVPKGSVGSALIRFHVDSCSAEGKLAPI